MMNTYRFQLLHPLVALFFAFLISACDDKTSSATAITTASIEQTTSLTLSTPNPSWSLTPTSAFQVANEIWCFYQLTSRDGMFAQVISQATAGMKFSAQELPKKNFVLGKTWSWESDPDVIFIDSMSDLADQLTDANPIDIVSQQP